MGCCATPVSSREMPYWEIVLPVGISFFTFQGISYIVDLYRGDLDRPRPFVDVMLFISFFPHLVAGPIVRASRVPAAARAAARTRTAVFVSARHLPDRAGACSRRQWWPTGCRSNLVDPVFRTPLRIWRRRHPAGDLRLRHPDLLRFQRLQRHRHRHRRPARLSLPAQLQPALSGPVAAGFLAPLAHVAVELAARLPVHPARRQPEGQGADLRQPVGRPW